ncbi:MAG: DUF4350 domain-containing protein, partial [Myxococcota bacterium]
MRRGLAIVLALAAGLVIVLMGYRVSERGRFAVPYSSYGSGPEGTRGLFLLAERLGARPVRWARDLSGLPPDAVLVALGGCENRLARNLSRYERESVAEWVNRGGVMIVAGAHNYLWPELGVDLGAPVGGCFPAFDLSDAVVREEDEDSEEARQGLSD